MSRIAGRDRRALVLGAGVVIIALIALRGVPAIRHAQAVERREAERLESQLAEARSAISGAAAGVDSSSALTAQWASQRARTFTSPTVNGLAAQIGGHVSRAARAAQLDLTSIQVRPDTFERAGFREASGRASLRGDVRGLADLLAVMEGGPKLIRILALTVAQSDPVGRPDAPERLSIEVAFRTLAFAGPATAVVPEIRVDKTRKETARAIVAGNPFRIDRIPAPVAFMPNTGALKPVATAVVVPRPVLLLRGIVGPPWQALLEGVPGKQGAIVVRPGDRFGELRIERIRHDTVVVRGADTTWRLAVARVWR